MAKKKSKNPLAPPKREGRQKAESTPEHATMKPPETPQCESPGPHKASSSVIIAGIAIALLLVFIGMRVLYPADEASEKTSPSQIPINLTPAVIEEPALPPQPRGGPINQTFSFDEVFKRIRSIDKTANTDFRKESLRKSLLPIQRIEPALIDLAKLRDEINRSVIDNETIYWIHLVEGRINMLESQRYFQLALAFGTDGLFSKKNISGSCERQNTILDAALLYNQSAMKGGRAMNHFDEVLTQEKTWPMIGVNDKRMAFYGGDTRDIGGMAYNTVEAIRVHCMGLEPGDLPSYKENMDY